MFATSTNHAANPWTLVAEGNTFIGVPKGVYYMCRVNDSDTLTTNPPVAEFKNNTFKDASRYISRIIADYIK